MIHACRTHSVEQPGSSRLYLLRCYKVLITLGCVITHMCFCNFGSAFQKASKWLHNKPWLVPLAGTCSCPSKGNHFVIQGSFTPDSILEFDQKCQPDATAVYRRKPRPGEQVSSFSASYPVRLMRKMASGSAASKIKAPHSIPQRGWVNL